LRPDRARIAADGEDVSMVTVEVVDAQGRVVPVADHEVSFKVSGSGKLLGVATATQQPRIRQGRQAPRVQRAGDGLLQAGKQAARCKWRRLLRASKAPPSRDVRAREVAAGGGVM